LLLQRYCRERVGDGKVPVLIVTTEKSGIDRYSQELAKRLDVKTIETQRYLSLIKAFRLFKKVQGERDIVHLPNQNFARYALFLNNPFIVTVHDVIRFCFDFSDETISERLLLKLDIRGIKRANRIIAVSQHTKNDITKYFKIPENNISVIYNGIDHTVFKPYQVKLLDKPYILYVGSERPRKNLGRLFAAFAKLKPEFPELKLLKIGATGRSKEYRRDTIKQIADSGISQDVIFVDRASETDLAHYYSSAALLAYPSLYEGFGLPPLEAMACGCPVVTSNISGLPEVVGNAGIIIDPYDIDSLAQAMKQVLTDNKKREEMVAKGLIQARKFSWERAAQETLKVYKKVTGER